MTEPTPTVVDLLRRAAPGDLADRLRDGPGFGVRVAGRLISWHPFEETREVDNRTLLRLASDRGLEAAVRVRFDPRARFAVYRTTLTNIGAAALQPITALSPLLLSIGDIRTPPRVMSSAGGGAPGGGYPPRGAYWTRWDLLQFPHSRRGVELSAEGDQSSTKDLPIVFVSPDIEPDAAGFIIGLEWSAGWTMSVRYEPDDQILVADAGPAVRDLVLAPGESLELPPAHVIFFEGGFEQATNRSRGYIREHITPRYQGRQVVPPVAYTIWPGIQAPYTDRDIYPQIDTAAKLGVEVFIVDDAWYEGRFPGGCGNWYPDPAKFPDGLERVVDRVEEQGMRFGLFIDAEAEPGTWILREHPEFFYGPELGSAWTPHRRLYNFSLPEACDYYLELLGGLIERYHVRYFRWDYNMDGHPIFQSVDPTLKVKFAHLAGLYRVWETLLERHPTLMLECCAGGGQRLDFGTMRRHHACWCSDSNAHPHIYHAMQAGGNAFFPANYLGSSLGWPPSKGLRGRPGMTLHPDAKLTDLSFLSRMAGELFLHGTISEWPAAAKERARHWIDVYKRVRHLLMLDYYRLLPQPQSEADWNVMQFAAGSEEGIVFAFRVAGEMREQRIALQAVDPAARYRVRDESSGVGESLTGEQLTRGLLVALQPESAKLLSYRVDSRGDHPLRSGS